MRPIITLAGIDEALSNLNFSNKNALKHRLIKAIRQYYSDENKVESIREIDTDELVKLLWDTGDDPAVIKNRRKNFSSIKSSLNSELNNLYRNGQNSEGVIIGPKNVFDMSDEAKSEILEAFTYNTGGNSPVPLGKLTEVLEIVSDILGRDKDSIEADDPDESNRFDQLKNIVQRLSEIIGISMGDETKSLDQIKITYGDGEEAEEIEIEDDPEVEEIEDDEEFEEEVIEEEPEAEIEEVDDDEDLEEVEIEEEPEEIEEIEDDEGLEEVELEEWPEEEETLEDTEPEEELEEVELDEVPEEEEVEELGPEEEIEEIEDEEELEEVDGDEDLEEVEIEEEPEEIEEIDDDEELEEVELDEVPEEEEVEELEPEEEKEELESEDEIEEIEDDEELEELDLEEEPVEELDDDEGLEEFESEDEIEEIEDGEELEVVEFEEEAPDRDFSLEDLLDEYGDEGYQGEDGIKKARLLAEGFNHELSAMDRYYNQYILIPKGKYPITNGHQGENAGLQKMVRLESFYFGKFPVTNALFEIFIEKTGYTTTAERLGHGTVYYGRYQKGVDQETGMENFKWNSALISKQVEGACWYQPLGPGSTLHKKRIHPVVQVSKEDAMAFAAWTGKRLPSEQEWEAASRTSRGYEFPWGREFRKGSCNNEESCTGDTSPVDEYKDYANSLGIIDTMGNVMEWTLDRAETPSGENSDRKGYIIKGGSWISGNDLRLSSRFISEPETTSNILGFRCVAY